MSFTLLFIARWWRSASEGWGGYKLFINQVKWTIPSLTRMPSFWQFGGSHWRGRLLSPFSLLAEAQAEEPAAETDHGPTEEPHLGDQLHAGRQELRHNWRRWGGVGIAGTLTGRCDRVPAEAALYRRTELRDSGQIRTLKKSMNLPEDGGKRSEARAPVTTAEEEKTFNPTKRLLSICRYQFNKGLAPVEAQLFISSSHCVRLLLPHIGALQSSQGLHWWSFLFLRYGPLEPCLKSSAIPSVLFRPYRSAIFSPISWTRQRSTPIGPDVSSGCLVKDSADPMCTTQRCLVLLSSPWFPSLRSALSQLIRKRVVFPRVAATNINGGLKLGEGRTHFFIIPSVFSYSVHGLKCSAGRHLQPLPVGSLTVTFNQLTCWLFLLFVISGSSINSSR